MGMALHHFCARREPVKARRSKVFQNEIDFFDTSSISSQRKSCTARRVRRFRASFHPSFKLRYTQSL
jgi:hypothetical protein